jgi:hypothetical protein
MVPTFLYVLYSGWSGSFLDITVITLVSIISGTGAAPWSKTNFWPTGHHHSRSSPLPCICTIPSTSAIFLNASLKSCRVRVWDCLDCLICVKMAAFQLYCQPGKQRKVGWAGDDSHVVFSKKNSLVKKEVWECVVVMQQLVLLLSKFGMKSLHIFMHSP